MGLNEAVSGAPLGRVLGVNGSQANVQLRVGAAAGADRATVGKFLGIRTASSLVIGVITKIAVEGGREPDTAVAQVDLLGEILNGTAAARFQRGVTEYPRIGDAANLVGQGDLRLVFASGTANAIDIGNLQQDSTIRAAINVDEMVQKHFAVLGTTGVGKSTGIAVMMHEVLKARPDLRVLMIDPHNEYGSSFGDQAQVLNPKNLKLPFWLFNFEEIVDVFFRGRPGLEDEVEILSDVIPIAKSKFETGVRPDRVSLRRDDLKGKGTVDTPVPYRLDDVIALVDERMGKLENRSTWTKYHRLLTRIETARNDPRYAFMFDNANVGGDTMVEVLSQLFRLPANGRPMTIMQLAGFPSEVVDSVVSVLCRMAFEFGLWSDGAFPLLVVCEEAHRYAPADRSIGFGPTRKAVSRIAKEGRKYGVFLGLITQRPAELDATIISQCSTLFAMRMANERDQAIVKSAVSDAAASLLAFVPTLGTREVFAFGEGVALPTRLRFKELPAHLIPKSESVGHRMDATRGVDHSFLASVVERWRGATVTRLNLTGSQPDEVDAPAITDIDALAQGEFAAIPSAPPRREMPAPIPPKPSAFEGDRYRRNAVSPDSYAFPVEPVRGQPLRPFRK